MESQQDVAWDWNAIPGPNNLQEDSVFKSPPSSDEMIQPRAQMMDRRLKPNVEMAPKCPRCDSANTKFCYYNNYSLSQPRYFCKTCRRYWTKGGSLRNVPVGGGCRKNKRSKRTSDNSSSSHNDNNNSSSSTSATPTHNEINLCSPPPPPGMDQMNLPAVPPVYFSLLEGAGPDSLNVGYSTRGFVDHHHAALMAGIEVSSSSGATDLLPPLPNLPNLAAALQSLKGQSKGEQQQPPSCTGTSDPTHIYDAQVVSSSPDAFGMVRDHGGINNPPHMMPAECDLQQWQSRLANNMLMDDHNALRNLINSNNSQQHHEDSRSLAPCNWQLPSENSGLLDNNMNMVSYNWNVGGAAWSDLSSYIPSYSNPLI